MKNIFFYILLLPFIARAYDPSDLHKVAMFANAERRNPITDYQGRIERPATAIVKINFEGANCTGFFIKNKFDRFLIATAQHCVKYKVKESCTTDGIKIKTANGSHQGYCESVLSAPENSDYFIFEARFDDTEIVRHDITFLKLANYFPSAKLPLKLIGYPGDSERKGQLTITDNCYVLPNFNSATDYRTTQDKAYMSQNSNATPATIDHFSQERRATIMKFSIKRHHNCSVYGGNSGGPLIVEGTEDVVGMPLSYLRLPVTRKFPENTGLPFEISQSIIEKSKRVLEDYKVIFADPRSF